jgi:putative ABC transport system permease protein
VVGADVPKLANVSELVGNVVSAGDRGYEVVGVLAATSVETSSVAEIPSIEWNRALVVPIGAEPVPAEEAEGRYPIDFAVLHFETARHAEAAAAVLARTFEADGQEGFRVTSPLQTLRQYKTSRQTFDRLIGLVCLLTAASAVFGISNQMSASVIARTREIGVRRAVGARPVDIVIQFQAEGVILGVVGGGLGLLIGVVVSLLTVDRSGGGLSLSLASFCALAGGCIIIGILTGIRPAHRAARIDPAAALRDG